MQNRIFHIDGRVDSELMELTDTILRLMVRSEFLNYFVVSLYWLKTILNGKIPNAFASNIGTLLESCLVESAKFSDSSLTIMCAETYLSFIKLFPKDTLKLCAVTHHAIKEGLDDLTPAVESVFICLKSLLSSKTSIATNSKLSRFNARMTEKCGTISQNPLHYSVFLNYIGIIAPNEYQDSNETKGLINHLYDYKMIKQLKMNDRYWRSPKNYRYLSRAKKPILNWVLWNAAVMSLDSHAESIFGSPTGLAESLRNSFVLECDELEEMTVDQLGICCRLIRLCTLLKFADLIMDLTKRHQEGHSKIILVKPMKLDPELQFILLHVSALTGHTWFIEKYAPKVSYFIEVHKFFFLAQMLVVVEFRKFNHYIIYRSFCKTL